jgi:hypothetical protein
MGMDKNIKYVREQRVAPLLNDMVMHLLATTPTDPLTALITYLERRQHQDRHSQGPAPPAEGRPEAGRKAVKPGKGVVAAAKRGDDGTSQVAAAPGSAAGAGGAVPEGPIPLDSEVGRLLDEILKSEQAFAAKLRGSGVDADTIKGYESNSMELQGLVMGTSATNRKLEECPLMSVPRLTAHVGRLLEEIEDNERKFLKKLESTTEAELDVMTYGMAVQNCADILRLVGSAETVHFATKFSAEQHVTKTDPTTHLCKKSLDILGQMRRAEEKACEPLMVAYREGVMNNHPNDALNIAIKQYLEMENLLVLAEMNQVAIEGKARNGNSLGSGGLAVLQEVTKDIGGITKKLKLNFQHLGGAKVDEEGHDHELARIATMNPKKQVELLLAEIAREEALFLEELIAISHTANEDAEAVALARANATDIMGLTLASQTKNRSITAGVPEDIQGIAEALEQSTRAINATMLQINRSTASCASKPSLILLGQMKKDQEEMNALLKEWKPTDKDETNEQKQAMNLALATMEALQDVAKMTALLQACIKHK